MTVAGNDKREMKKPFKIGLNAAARLLRVNAGHLSRVLRGERESQSLKRRYQELLKMKNPRFSVPAAKPTKPTVKDIWRSIGTLTAGQLPAMENMMPDFQATLGKLGITVVVLVADASPGSPFWNNSDNDAPFNAQLAEARAGEFDSVRMMDGLYVAYYHAGRKQFAKTLSVLKKGLETRALLDHAAIFYIQENSQWVSVWPATAEIIDPNK